MPGFENIKSQLEHKTTSSVPDILISIDDVNINRELAETWPGQRNLLLLHNDWGLHSYFARDENLRLLQQYTTIFVDSTFRTAPHPYVPFFTMHGHFNNRVFTFVNGLLCNKDIASYRQLLSAVKDANHGLTGNNWSSTICVCAFE